MEAKAVIPAIAHNIGTKGTILYCWTQAGMFCDSYFSFFLDQPMLLEDLSKLLACPAFQVNSLEKLITLLFLFFCSAI